MKTVLTGNEITRESLIKFFKEIINYKFVSCDSYKYVIESGKYNFIFAQDCLIVRYNKDFTSRVCINYNDIKEINLYTCEDDSEIYLQFDTDNGTYFGFDINKAEIEVNEKVKAELYGN